MRNPLTLPLIRLLQQQPEGCREYDLIKAIDADGGFPNLAQDSQLALFQKHFLVKNALFQLQLTLWQEEQVYLYISALEIRVVPGKPVTSEQTLPGTAGDASIRDYYLDWSNYENATTESVEALLNSFWQRYASHDKRDEALDVLQLPADASQAMIKQQYRRLASQHHPDKGGDSQQFIALRQAYETLCAAQ